MIKKISPLKQFLLDAQYSLLEFRRTSNPVIYEYSELSKQPEVIKFFELADHPHIKKYLELHKTAEVTDWLDKAEKLRKQQDELDASINK